MSDNPLTPRELLEREHARLLEAAAEAAAKAEAITRDLADLDRLSKKFNFIVAPVESLATEGTLRELVARYRSHERSPYAKLQFSTRSHYDDLMRPILEHLGEKKLADFTTKDIQDFYDEWTDGGTKKLSMGHALITMLRGFIHFGAAIEYPDCERLSVLLHNMRFVLPASRRQPLTIDHAKLIIEKAHEKGVPSLALAQAIQFDCKMPQRDVIGEWVPIGEDGVSEVLDGDTKWLRGIRWDEIDANWVLHRSVSSRNSAVVRSLRKAPLVSRELARFAELPKHGPVIVSERSGLPWRPTEFRRYWRMFARECGIPDDVKNMDSRSSGGGDDEEELKKERPADANLHPTGRVR